MMKKLLLAAITTGGFFVLTGQKAEPPLAVYTAAQADAGRIVFQTLGATQFKDNACVNCHTSALTGRNGDPGELPPLSSFTPELQKIIQQYGTIPPLAGAKFLTKWGLRTTQDLFNRVKDAAGPDEQTSLNLTAYILQFNGAKSGAQALTPATAVEIRSIVNGVAP